MGVTIIIYELAAERLISHGFGLSISHELWVVGQKEVLLLVWRIHLNNNLTGAHKCMHHADMVVNCWMCIQWSEELIDTAVNWHSLPRAAYAQSVCTAGQHGGLYHTTWSQNEHESRK